MEYKEIKGHLTMLGWKMSKVAEELQVSNQHLFNHLHGDYGRPQIKAFVNWLIQDQVEPQDTTEIDRWFDEYGNTE